MDGTVLDTEPMYKKAWRSAFERTNHEFSEELFNRCVGQPIYSTKRFINETYNNPDLFDLTFPMAAAWAHNYKKLNGIPVKPGFRELNDFLKEHDIKSVIATSTSHAAAVEDLAGSKILEHFIGVIGGDDVANGKPAPDSYIKAAELAGVSTEDCIAVEDSVNGIRSAVAAGVKCVYIKDFLEIPPEIEKLVYKKVNTLDEIIPIIENLS